MRAVRIPLFCLLATAALCGCGGRFFTKDYPKNFLYQPMMQYAIAPSEGLPDFAWADRCVENRLHAGTVAGGAGGGGCPT